MVFLQISSSAIENRPRPSARRVTAKLLIISGGEREPVTQTSCLLIHTFMTRSYQVLWV